MGEHVRFCCTTDDNDKDAISPIRGWLHQKNKLTYTNASESMKVFNYHPSALQLEENFTIMAKRKREAASGPQPDKKAPPKKAKAEAQVPKPSLYRADEPLTIQIVAGSYDRVLHGITATLAPDSDSCQFSDTFLFNAHTSAIRCLALSPPSAPAPRQTQKVILATGGSDERINLYNLSAHPPSAKSTDEQKLLSSIAPRPILENHNNRELGALLHHNSNITRLDFPTRSKLLSASEDSTIAVTRTRDWSVLHTFKCPIPKMLGRPSGDTAAHDGAPSGVNDFAVHPSMKVMLSASKSERCMRLWNLVTGKKARALNFSRAILTQVGEGRHSTGEARKIVWGSDAGEDEFAVGFDRDIVVYSMDCKAKCRVMKEARTKLHEFRYVSLGEDDGSTILAVSTDDGRILFFSTKSEYLPSKKSNDDDEDEDEDEDKDALPSAKLIAQVGGKAAGVSGRVKDFAVLPVRTDDGKQSWYVPAASSDGVIRVWQLTAEDLRLGEGEEDGKQVGKLRGSYETQNRITCMGAFVMIPRPDGAEESEFEFESEEEGEDEDESEAEN